MIYIFFSRRKFAARRTGAGQRSSACAATSRAPAPPLRIWTLWSTPVSRDWTSVRTPRKYRTLGSFLGWRGGWEVNQVESEGCSSSRCCLLPIMCCGPGHGPARPRGSCQRYDIRHVTALDAARQSSGGNACRVIFSSCPVIYFSIFIEEQSLQVFIEMSSWNCFCTVSQETVIRRDYFTYLYDIFMSYIWLMKNSVNFKG